MASSPEMMQQVQQGVCPQCSNLPLVGLGMLVVAVILMLVAATALAIVFAAGFHLVNQHNKVYKLLLEVNGGLEGDPLKASLYRQQAADKCRGWNERSGGSYAGSDLGEGDSFHGSGENSRDVSTNSLGGYPLDGHQSDPHQGRMDAQYHELMNTINRAMGKPDQPEFPGLEGQRKKRLTPAAARENRQQKHGTRAH